MVSFAMADAIVTRECVVEAGEELDFALLGKDGSNCKIGFEVLA